MANTWITMTQPSGGSRRKWTWSAWIKKGATGVNQAICVAYQDNANSTIINFESDDEFNFYEYQGDSVVGQKHISMKARDVNAWYHFMCIWDSENSTADDRMIIYVNGVRQTVFEASTNPSVNTSTAMNRNGYPVRIGTYNSNNYFNGSMSHVNFCGGQALAPTIFGETDATTGEWKIISDPTFTPGIGGYSILIDGNSLTDQSANSNNFSLGGGTLTKTEDNPSNVFATLNSLDSDLTSTPFLNGNTKVTGQNPDYINYYCGLTLGMMGNGKYYFEAQLNVNNQGVLGVCNLDASDNPTYLRQQNTFPGRYSSSFGYDLTDGGYYNNNSKTAYGGTSWSANDYVSFALDNTNKKMYIAKNGSWVNSGNPTNGTGGIDYSSIGDNNMFIVADNNSAGYNRFSFNFGNGAFDNTTLSTTYSPTVGATSAKFKYDIIPTGYTALSTKGLNI